MAYLNRVPPGLVSCTNLSLSLGGAPVWVEHLLRECPHDAPDWFRRNAPSDFSVLIASFPCPNPARLALQLQAPARAVLVRPKSLGVTAQGAGRDWQIDLPGPCKLLVEIDELPPLLVFAEPPVSAVETTASGEAAPTVFGPGEHNPGLITLTNGQRLVIEPGAIVYGGLRGGPRNARVSGGGILDGSRLREPMVRLTGASNVVVEGILIRGGRSWHNTLVNCDAVTYRNVKVLSFVPGGDGINPVNSRDILIDGCFLRCSDDCVAIKAPQPGLNVSNITVQNCTMAGYHLSDGTTIGYETVSQTMENITVRNCDILYARGGTRAGQHSAFSIICDGPSTIRNVTFENLRVEENVTRLCELNVTHAQHYTRTSPGRIQNVRVRNVRWEIPCPILLLGQASGNLVEEVLFEDCTIAGQPLRMDQIQTNAFTRGVVVRNGPDQ